MSPEIEQIRDPPASVTGALCIRKVAGLRPRLDDHYIETVMARG